MLCVHQCNTGPDIKVCHQWVKTSASLASPETAPVKAAKDSRPTCPDGIWSILQQGEELQASQPEVLVHALNVVAIMWQVS